jgi:hypothetical protein
MKKIQWLLGFGAIGLLAGCGTSTLVPKLPTQLAQSYAEKAITGVSLLASTGNVATLSAVEGPGAQLYKGPPTLVTEETLIEEFTEYIQLMDSFLTEEGAPFLIKEFTSDREGYTHQLEITVKDLTGNTYTYMMYFNLTEPTNENGSSEDSSEEENTSEVTSLEPTSEEAILANALARDGYMMDQDERDLRDRSDENSYQVLANRHLGDDEVFLVGIVIYEENEYQLIGFREEEDDEITTKFFIYLNDRQWIKIRQTLEENEEKYVLSMKKDGEFTRVSFKVETEDNELKIKLKTLINGQVISYTFHKETEDEQTRIRIKIYENGSMLHILAFPSIDAETGETVYTFYSLTTGKTYEGHSHGGRS